MGDVLASLDDLLTFISPLGDDFSFDILTAIQNKINTYLTALNTFAASSAFPNLVYQSFTHSFNHLTLADIINKPLEGGIFLKDIPNFPNVYMADGVLNWRLDFEGTKTVKSTHVNDLIIALTLPKNLPSTWSPLNFKRISPPSGAGIIAYTNAVRYMQKAFSYYAADKFVAIDTSGLAGALRLKQAKTEQKQVGGVWQGVTLPAAQGQIFISDLNPNLAAEQASAVEDTVKANATGTGLLVCRGGVWTELINF